MYFNPWHLQQAQEHEELVLTNMDRPVSRSLTRHDLYNKMSVITLLIVLGIIIFGLLLLLYIIQEKREVRSMSNRQESVNAYEEENFLYIVKMLLEHLDREKTNQTSPEYINSINRKVLHIMGNSSLAYKYKLILYLYEHGLIRTDTPLEQRIHLFGVNLTHIEFKSLNLSHISLPGVTAEKSHFSNCQLDRSDFQGSIMDYSSFINCSLQESAFFGASLKQTLFSDTTDLSGIDLTNTDLFNSSINIHRWKHSSSLTNARLPDGSFVNIDSIKLIKFDCQNLWIKPWQRESDFPPMMIVRQETHFCILLPVIANNHCYFQANFTARLIQDIDLYRYSTLIDSGQAGYNISAYLGCSHINSNDSATIEVRFNDEENNDDYLQVDVMNYGKTWKLLFNTTSIPVRTRTVQIMIGTSIAHSVVNIPTCCAIDDISFNLFQMNK